MVDPPVHGVVPRVSWRQVLTTILCLTPFRSVTSLRGTVVRQWCSRPRPLLMSHAATMPTSTTPSTPPAPSLQYTDIGANLLDARFLEGTYRGQHRHAPDWDCVLQRARDAGVRRILLTAGTLEESRKALACAREWNQSVTLSSSSATTTDIQFHSTVGIHPTRCQQEFLDTDLSDQEVLEQLLEIARDGMSDGTVVAIGEIGLDYDRTEFCSKPVQLEYLTKQLVTLAKATQLPLFLHNRSVGRDLVQVLVDHADCWKAAGGVAHSFDDSLELAQEFMGLGCYIGLNGCSLRTEENLETVRSLPLDRILLETDCPYCEVRPTHAGYPFIQTHFDAKAEKKFERGKLVKSRQEPCHVVQIAEIVAGCKEMELQHVAKACWENTHRLFFS